MEWVRTPATETDYTLDQLGNWTGYVEKTAGGTDLNQSRVHNDANEIYHATYGSAITESAGSSWIDHQVWQSSCTPLTGRSGSALSSPTGNDPDIASSQCQSAETVTKDWLGSAKTIAQAFNDSDGARQAGKQGGHCGGARTCRIHLGRDGWSNGVAPLEN